MPNTSNNLSQSVAELPITTIKGVGAKLANTLTKLGITCVQDALFHLPMRYLDRTRIVAISQLQLNTSVVIEGQVTSASVVFGRRRSLMVHIEDTSGRTTLRFFHFNAAQKNMFEVGARFRCVGEPRLGSNGFEFYHPEYERIDGNEARRQELQERLTPVYGLTEGITQLRMRAICEAAVELLRSHQLEELLPASTNDDFQVGNLSEALSYVHLPPKDVDIQQLLAGAHPYQQRLVFEELLAHYLTRQRSRQQAQKDRAPSFDKGDTLCEQLLSALSFAPTNAQNRVFLEIKRDMRLNKPMLRMVQGDVGSGKTLVAALAACMVVSNNFQVALVAPTEILAEQHFRNFDTWFTPLGIQVTWLVGKMSAPKKRESLAAIADGSAQIVIGTHALFQDGVRFAAMGLSIIDEQHRFGVNQRLSLREKSIHSTVPHQLVMTATPIPRTLAMTAYAELDYSVIDELPPGRTPVNTVLMGPSKREQIIDRISAACNDGKQVYWVCPLVEESETLSAANAEETYAYLCERMPHANIGLVHGRLKSAEKETVVAQFKSTELDVLVATTVIEVGVDVPNASLMVIENPERLGLAQLHQLRGRVGRGRAASHCLLLYGDKLSQQARERLGILRETNDGFEIAEKDLSLRGPGELLGTRQTGDMLYRLANIERDAHLIPKVHATGDQLIRTDSKKIEAIINRWFGNRQHYVNA